LYADVLKIDEMPDDGPDAFVDALLGAENQLGQVQFIIRVR